jgi:SAM domain (Sterile alpha motif)
MGPTEVGYKFLGSIAMLPTLRLPTDWNFGAPMQQIADWLASLGMSEYAQRFADNAIDFSVLPDLTDQDLEKLGVLLGHRRKMLPRIYG